MGARKKATKRAGAAGPVKLTRKSGAGSKPARKLTRAEKVLLQDQFTNARGEVTEKDVARLVARGVGEAEALQRSTPGWKVNLAAQVKLLFDMLRDWWRGKVSFPKTTAFAIAAALLYFINPLDMFPDLIPVAGLLDDATVIVACVRLIQADLRAYCMDRDIELDAYGL